MEGTMSQEQKIVLQYSTAFKLKVVEQIERGELTVSQARRVYDIRGGQTIQKWLVKHGKSHLLSRVVRIEMKDEKDRIKELEAEKKKLESALAQAHVDNLFLKELVVIAKEEYGIDLKKNTATKPSSGSVGKEKSA
jgi:transposase-like protein